MRHAAAGTRLVSLANINPRASDLPSLRCEQVQLWCCMATEISRRSFFRGTIDHTPMVVMRPPGAVGQSFQTLCRDCDACRHTCPEHVISMDAEGRPVLNFAEAHCTFCGTCAEVCPTGALVHREPTSSNWRACIEDTCWSMNGVSCRMCQDACPESAIRFQLKVGGRAEPAIDVGACTGCGACSTVCPATSVSFFELPQEQDFAEEDVA